MNSYDIGDFVIVTGFYKKDSDQSYENIFWSKISGSEQARLGRVVGRCIRFEGIRRDTTRYSGYFDLDIERVAYLEITGQQIFYLVIFGWRNKPVLVKEEDMELAEMNEIKDLPELCTIQPLITKECRKAMGENAKEAPRDKKGRFIKI